MRPVSRVYVLDDLFTLRPRGQIEIDVGPLAPLLREKPFEEQIHPDGVDGGDRQGVADGGVGGGTPALDENTFLETETNDVVDDQKIAGKVQFLDQRQLPLDLSLGPCGQGPETHSGPGPGQGPEVRVESLAGRYGSIGEAIAEVAEGEVEPGGEVLGAAQRLREVGEEPGHHPGGAQSAFPVRFQPSPRRIQGQALTNAAEYVGEILRSGLGVTDAAGGDQGQTKAAGDFDQGAVLQFFLSQSVALEFDGKAAAEDRAQSLERAAGVVESTMDEPLSDEALRPAGQAVEPPGEFLDDGPRGPGPALGLTAGGLGQDAAEIAVARAVFDQQDEARQGRARRRRILDQPQRSRRSLGGRDRHLPVVQHDLRTDDGTDTGGPGGLEEAGRPGEGVAVDQGHRRKFECSGPRDEVLGQGRPLEKGEGRGDVEFGVHGEPSRESIIENGGHVRPPPFGGRFTWSFSV